MSHYMIYECPLWAVEGGVILRLQIFRKPQEIQHIIIYIFSKIMNFFIGVNIG
jgi:hypothetical protein